MTRWGFSTTGDEVASAFSSRIKGKTILITGPSPGGIGAETALSLAIGQPSLLLLAGRSSSKISPLISEISQKYPSIKVEFIPLDLSSQVSVREAADKINGLVEKIDILINNAAIMVCPFEKTREGVELQFATNYLGHFLLTNLLIGKMLKAEAPKVVNVSSSAHKSGVIRWEDINFEDGKVYQEWEAYGQSKSAIILFSHALASRLKKHGGFSFSLHPGSITTGLQVHMNKMDQSLLAEGIQRAIAAEKALGREFKMPQKKTLQQGCSTTLVAALDPEVEERNGAYLADGGIAADAPPEYLSLPENEVKLWELSEGLVGQKFDW